MDIDTLHSSLVSLTRLPEEIRSARENLLTRDGDPRAAVAQFLDVVERDLRVAKAALARDLGFALCQCCWPPELMVTDSAGRVDCAARLQTNPAASSGPDSSAPFRQPRCDPSFDDTCLDAN